MGTRDSFGARHPPYAALWIVFFTIAFGLGYPALNRYDTTQSPGTADSLQYSRMVERGPAAAVDHWRYRVLIPSLAQPIARAASGHVGSWNPVSLALLIVNASFCAASGVMLVAIGLAFGFPFVTGLVAAFAWLLNFQVANFYLAGIVDSAEACLMMALALVLRRRMWNLLPLLGAIGGVAKETAVPLALLFAWGWVWRAPRKPWIQIGGLAVLGLAVVVLVHYGIDGRVTTPWQIVAQERHVGGWADIGRAALKPFTSWVTWITVVWMLPFAFRAVSRLPGDVISATAAAVGGVFALVVWHDAGSNLARPLFSVAGPLVCLAFAIGVTQGSAASGADVACHNAGS